MNLTPALLARAAEAFERDRRDGHSPSAAMRSALAVLDGAAVVAPLSHGVPDYIVAVFARVAEANGLTLDDLRRSSKRKGRTTNRCGRVRGEAVYLARELSDVSFKEIGRYFGGRGYATMQSAREAFVKRMAGNEVLRARVERIIGAKREAGAAA